MSQQTGLTVEVANKSDVSRGTKDDKTRERAKARNKNNEK